MKTANIDVHGVYCLCNTGSIEVHIEEGYDPLIYWRYSINRKTGARPKYTIPQKAARFFWLVVYVYIWIRS